MADITHLLETTFHYRFPTNQQNLNFFVIGAGGTGGYLIPNLTRQLSIANANKTGLKHKITIVDGDVVERKNLIRQNFVESDIDKNKAEVMAKRYGRAFTQEVSYVESYLNDPEHFQRMINDSLNSEVNHSKQHVVIIDCTDNNKTRLLMKTTAQALKRTKNVVFLSSGNEEKAGQVVCSFKLRDRGAANISNGQGLRQDVCASTPDFFDVFPDTEIDKLPEEVSCAENAISAPQNIATNMTAANVLFSFANKLIANESISELAVFFDSSMISQKVYRAKLSDFKGLLSLAKNNKAMAEFLPRDEYSFVSGVNPIEAMTWAEAEKAYQLKKAAENAELQAKIDTAVASK